MAGLNFRDYNNMFTKEQLQHTRAKWLDQYFSPDDYTGWPFTVGTWSQKEIQYAVYEAEGFLEWQEFRVSMKGCTTHEKLYMLDRWLFVKGRTSWLQKCRVDNYIGALVRGGQLGITLAVQR